MFWSILSIFFPQIINTYFYFSTISYVWQFDAKFLLICDQFNGQLQLMPVCTQVQKNVELNWWILMTLFDSMDSLAIWLEVRKYKPVGSRSWDLSFLLHKIQMSMTFQITIFHRIKLVFVIEKFSYGFYVNWMYDYWLCYIFIWFFHHTCNVLVVTAIFKGKEREKNNSTEDFLKIIVNLSRCKENKIVENEDEKFKKKRRVRKRRRKKLEWKKIEWMNMYCREI